MHAETYPQILDVSRVLLIPVHDATNIWLDHTDSSLGCSLSLYKAAIKDNLSSAKIPLAITRNSQNPNEMQKQLLELKKLQLQLKLCI